MSWPWRSAIWSHNVSRTASIIEPLSERGRGSTAAVEQLPKAADFRPSTETNVSP
jgi:hypothetical protein